MERTWPLFGYDDYRPSMKYVCGECGWSVPVSDPPDGAATRALFRHALGTRHSPIGTPEALGRPPTDATVE